MLLLLKQCFIEGIFEWYWIHVTVPLIIWAQWFCKWFMSDKHNPWPGGYPCPSTRYCIVSVKHSKNPILYCSAIKTDFSDWSSGFSVSAGSGCFVPRDWYPAVTQHNKDYKWVLDICKPKDLFLLNKKFNNFCNYSKHIVLVFVFNLIIYY